MDQRAALDARVISLLQDLKAAEDTIVQMPGDTAAVVRNRLAAATVERRQPLATLRKNLADPAAASVVAMHWLNYLKRQKECCELFEESLPVLQGLALRLLGWDQGLCRIADRLLTNLANGAGMDWDRITLLAVGEQFRPLPQIIWIRYPTDSIWDLPIAAHELGHYLGPRLEKEQGGKTTRPLQNLLDAEEDPVKRRLMHETLADIFAVYALGPAYACTCFMSRFDPVTAHIDGQEHPSAARRGYAILKSLEQLDGGQFGTFSSIADSLRVTWEATLMLFGHQARIRDELGQAIFQVLDEQTMLLYKKLDDRLKGMRYGITDWTRCKKLAADLVGDAALPVVGRYSIADVLNAAWYARMVDMEQGNRMTAHLGQLALERCKLLAQ